MCCCDNTELDVVVYHHHRHRKDNHTQHKTKSLTCDDIFVCFALFHVLICLFRESVFTLPVPVRVCVCVDHSSQSIIFCFSTMMMIEQQVYIHICEYVRAYLQRCIHLVWLGWVSLSCLSVYDEHKQIQPFVFFKYSKPSQLSRLASLKALSPLSLTRFVLRYSTNNNVSIELFFAYFFWFLLLFHFVSSHLEITILSHLLLLLDCF